jgi:hypothetical protein
MIIFILLTIILTISSYNFNNKFLTNNQWNDIRFIIKKNKNPIIRNKINKIIYSHYEKYAYYQSIKFKKKYFYKLSHISLDELFLYTSRGLYNSIKNYDGRSCFIKYANIYIKFELYKYLKIINPISKYYIGNNIDYFDYITYKKNIYENNNPNNNSDNMYYNYWIIINKMNSELKIICKYKFNYRFEIIRTNKEIGKLMCCSEENIRLKLKIIKYYLISNLYNEFPII